ncbi:DUF2586 family protein [Empedobacter brevis]
MGLPKITFNILNGGLNYSTGVVQKIPALIVTGVTVAQKVTIGQSYQVFSLKDAETLGITEAENPFAYKHIKAFYDVAGSGVELWLMLVSDATTLTQITDKTQEYASKLIADAKGKVRVLGLVKKSTGAEEIENGLDADVTTAVINLQALADECADKYMPFRAIVSGNSFSGTVADLKDYKETDLNRVHLLISNNDGSKEASIGLELGRLASIPAQRSVARVKDGAIEPLKAYFTNGQAVETLANAMEAIHAKGYTFLRSFAGRSGYYFSDDQTLTKDTDDFKTLANGFVMDEAVLIAYDTLIEELSDEVPLTETGNIHPALIKSWQNNIEENITSLMISQGKLSGVKCEIDTNQNIVSTGVMNVIIKLLPVGYAKEIEVQIGFTTTLE